VPQPIDVGSILGGRYKVTGRILASAEKDVILDGLDQVLNRPVSILVSAPENTATLTQSAREVATGERVSNVSIMDLGTQDGCAYIIAGRTSPADLLDLVVPTEPHDEEVYREPFFTDTLSTEIFGSARDAAPSNTAYVYEDDSPLTPSKPMPIVPLARPVAPAAKAPVAAKPAAVVPPVVPKPKVTLLNEDDYGTAADEPPLQARKAGIFPAAVREASENYDSTDGAAEFEDDEENAPRSGGRWLTGVIVAVLIVAALFFAVNHIGTLFNGGTPVAGGKDTTAQAQQTTAGGQPSKPPAPVAPVIAGLTDITTFAPGVANYAEPNFPRLKDAIDNNKGTYWPTVEYSSADFAGLTDGINLVVELKEESTISSVTINQIGGSGGQFDILTNSKPVLEGATKIGSGSFSAPDFTLKPAQSVEAKYVIISFKELPKLQPFLTYPYGLKIAEISIK